MDEPSEPYTPVTYDNCSRVEGPFYHGTRWALEVGTELVPGYGSNYQEGRVSNNIYFSALVETAAWGAELATALAGSRQRRPGNVQGRASLVVSAVDAIALTAATVIAEPPRRP